MKSLSSRRVEGLPVEVGAGRLELILIRERSLITPQSGIDIIVKSPYYDIGYITITSTLRSIPLNQAFFGVILR